MNKREAQKVLRDIEPELSVEISELLKAGITLDEIIQAVLDKYGCNSWKFSRTEGRYKSCIMAIFEPVR